MTDGETIAAQALTLCGAPFRLHGRSARTGVDCVGLVLLALRGAGRCIAEPPSYALRGMGQARASALLDVAGLRPVDDLAMGDILLVESGPMQLHLMIRASGGFVHAHAGLGRVVLMPPPVPWPLLGAWRAVNASNEDRSSWRP